MYVRMYGCTDGISPNSTRLHPLSGPLSKKHQTRHDWIKMTKNRSKTKLAELMFATEPSLCKILSLHKNNKNAKNKNMIPFQKRFMLETCFSKCKIRSLETDLEFYKKNIKNFVILFVVISQLFLSNINHDFDLNFLDQILIMILMLGMNAM